MANKPKFIQTISTEVAELKVAQILKNHTPSRMSPAALPLTIGIYGIYNIIVRANGNGNIISGYEGGTHTPNGSLYSECGFNSLQEAIDFAVSHASKMYEDLNY